MSETEIQKLQDEITRLKKLAYYDALTGLLNRHGFHAEIDTVFHTLIARKQTEKRASFHVPFSVIFFDIDNFKKINDTYGHDGGDAVLKHIGSLLPAHLRKSDTAARWGGEEFVISLLGATEENAARVAENLRVTLSHTPIQYKDSVIPCTASFGVSEYTKESELEEFIEKADKAMYYAKTKLNKNSIARFSQIQYYD